MNWKAEIESRRHEAETGGSPSPYEKVIFAERSSQIPPPYLESSIGIARRYRPGKFLPASRFNVTVALGLSRDALLCWTEYQTILDLMESGF